MPCARYGRRNTLRWRARGVEWARDGIRVNSVLTRDTGDTLGNLAAYLVSDYAAYVTGAVIGIDLDD